MKSNINRILLENKKNLKNSVKITEMRVKRKQQRENRKSQNLQEGNSTSTVFMNEVWTRSNMWLSAGRRRLSLKRHLHLHTWTLYRWVFLSRLQQPIKLVVNEAIYFWGILCYISFSKSPSLQETTTSELATHTLKMTNYLDANGRNINKLAAVTFCFVGI